jgi:hypothetical protein
MTINAHAIALYTFAQDHDPLPELPALCPATVTLALPATNNELPRRKRTGYRN